jgi:hypothetical protein
MTTPPPPGSAVPEPTGIGYIVGGFVAGFVAFIPAVWLVWFTLGCWSEDGVCEFSGVTALATLFAFGALLAPIVGGSISASRGRSDALEIGAAVGGLTMVAQWVLVLGVLA